jgi:hypothetical protein
MKTFEQFQATRTACDDLGAHPNLAPEWFLDAEGNERTAAGFVYDGDCYIERLDDGRFYLIIANMEWTDDDRAALERELYQWCVDEGVL